MPATRDDMRIKQSWAPPLLFITARFIWLISSPLENLRIYGDLGHFFRLAGKGWPFLDYWVEFPPLFPFLSAVIYRVAGGREYVYDTLLIFLLTITQAACLWVFQKIAERIYPADGSGYRTWIFLFLSLPLAYTWWYFDPFALLALLAGIFLLIEKEDIPAGLAIGIGFLIKLFPVLLLAAAIAWRGFRKSVRSIVVALAVIIPVYGILYIAAPDMTRASLVSQGQKGSWETVWALVDGNFQTGNISDESLRTQAAMAYRLGGNPSRIPAMVTLIPFLLTGLFLLKWLKVDTAIAAIRFLGVTMSLFFLWSPGWSPQWVLYLVPVILLSFPLREGSLFTLCMTLINLLEWPILLSRGYFWSLWITIPARTVLLALLAARLGYDIWRSNQVETEVSWKAAGQISPHQL